MKKLIYILLIFCSVDAYSQQTFGDIMVINIPSVEMTDAKRLDVRIMHRFGDMAGDNGGWSNFYGLENASDISIGAIYGMNDRFNIGLSRTKGAGPLKRLVHLSGKYLLMDQFEGTVPIRPVSIAVQVDGTIATQEANNQPETITSFEEFSHRLTYTTQVMIARRFGSSFSLQAGGAWVHRNLVEEGMDHDIYAITGASRIRLSKVWNIVLDASYPLNDMERNEEEWKIAVGAGVEIITGGGHSFQINFTNARALHPADYIPFTDSNPLEGELRLGFTISRIFNL